MHDINEKYAHSMYMMSTGTPGDGDALPRFNLRHPSPPPGTSSQLHPEGEPCMHIYKYSNYNSFGYSPVGVYLQGYLPGGSHFFFCSFQDMFYVITQALPGGYVRVHTLYLVSGTRNERLLLCSAVLACDTSRDFKVTNHSPEVEP